MKKSKEQKAEELREEREQKKANTALDELVKRALQKEALVYDKIISNDQGKNKGH